MTYTVEAISRPYGASESIPWGDAVRTPGLTAAAAIKTYNELNRWYHPQGGDGYSGHVRIVGSDGETCDGAEFCCRCNRQIFSGYKFGDERYCDSHKPETWDAEVAAMSEEEFDNQDNIYWTQWEIEDIDCDCPQDCQCRPTPASLQALYDADRATD
jgi:hypothetical protein